MDKIKSYIKGRERDKEGLKKREGKRKEKKKRAFNHHK
jgi:hypothetical protein